MIGDRTMEDGRSKRSVVIKREHKVSFSARKFRILVDGQDAGYIENGGVLRLKLPYRDTDIAFAIGKKVMQHIYLDDSDGEDVNIVCSINGSGGIIANKSYIDFSTTTFSSKKGIPLIVRIIIAVPIVILMYYLIRSSMDSFLAG